MIEVIDSFSGKYEFLSNFSRDRDGLTVEHRYQAAKAALDSQFTEILESDSPGKAKRLGQKAMIRPDWEQAKYWIMHSLVMYKFISDPKLMEKLLETGDAELIEGNTWHDLVWGNCTCEKCSDKEGKNWLGEILTDVRNYVRMVSVIPSKHEDINDINTL